jgi:histidinol-phosphatase
MDSDAEDSPMALDDLGLALDLARRASEIALDFSERGVQSELKADGSPVTEADLAIESALLATLAKERPDDSILSEERGELGDGDRRWLIDPLDGTSLFLDALGGWGTLITLQENGESVLAVITRPLESKYWWAMRGVGAFSNDLSVSPTREQPLKLSDAGSLSEARVTAWGDRSSPEINVLSDLPGWIEPGVDSFERLVGGEVDVVVSLGGLVWDHAPCVLILEEAGGTFRDRRGGRRLDLLGGVYSNTQLSGPIGQIIGWY